MPIEDLVRDLRDFVPRQLDSSGVPGLSIAVVRGGEVVWAQGFGVRNAVTRQRVQEDTTSSVASLSKTVTAYGALRLVSRGQLGLDVPLDRYVDHGFVPSGRRRAGITMRRVLTHTSGLSNLFVGLRADKRIYFAPGSHFSYSGHGFEYARSAIEGASGERFERYMQGVVLDELQMDSSSYRPGGTGTQEANPHVTMKLLVALLLLLWAPLFAAALVAWWFSRLMRRRGLKPDASELRVLATVALSLAGAALALLVQRFGFSPGLVVLVPLVAMAALVALLAAQVRWLAGIVRRRGRTARGAVLVGRVLALVATLVVVTLVGLRPAIPLPAQRMSALGAGGLHSSAVDMGRFLSEVLEPRHLDPSLVTEMLRPQVRVNDRVSWGLGLGLQRGPHGVALWNWGSNPGSESLMIGYPSEDIGVVVLTNGGPMGAGLEVAERVAFRAIGGDYYSSWNAVPGSFLPA